jgi:hypothetical protein
MGGILTPSAAAAQTAVCVLAVEWDG